jgi:hypothetical protein
VAFQTEGIELFPFAAVRDSRTSGIFISIEQPLRIRVSPCTFRACSRVLVSCVARPRVRSPSAAVVDTHRSNSGDHLEGAPLYFGMTCCLGSSRPARASTGALEHRRRRRFLTDCELLDRSRILTRSAANVVGDLAQDH